MEGNSETLAQKPSAEQQPLQHDFTPAPTGFLHLSAELRNRIYHLTLLSAAWIDPCPYAQQPAGDQLAVATLRTCRAIHRQATPIFYGQNCFMNVGKHFQSMIGPSARFIRRVSLHNMCHCIHQDEGYYSSCLKTLPALVEVNMPVDVDGDLWRYPGELEIETRLMAETLFPLSKHLLEQRGNHELDKILSIFHFQKGLRLQFKLVGRKQKKKIRRCREGQGAEHALVFEFAKQVKQELEWLHWKKTNLG